MKRTLLTVLNNWLISAHRKPLVLRGARQVGKTWLVRELAKVNQKVLIEINFEKNPQYISLFDTNEVAQIVLNLSATFNQKISPENFLLFLDEIQVAPQLLSKLRWFMEGLPELPVIGAGSLLEFTLENYQFSMPVGRIQYMHLEAMSFEEFLQASDQGGLLEYLKAYNLKEATQANIPEVLHEKLMLLFKEYLIIGGLPEAVYSWIRERDVKQVNQIHHDLLNTYRDDFAKYSGRLDVTILDTVMRAVPRMLGAKFVYQKVGAKINASAVKNALNLLNKARICHTVWATSANGLPLGSQIRDKYLKQIFLDTGLASAQLGLSLNQLKSLSELDLVDNGAIAEQVVGQLLRTISPSYIEPALYYWQREEKGSAAELDYIIEHGNRVIPVEVKAGSTGSLKSLHLFMGSKNLSLALRINSDLPSKVTVDLKDVMGKRVTYQLLSLPFYLISETYRLLDESLKIN